MSSKAFILQPSFENRKRKSVLKTAQYELAKATDNPKLLLIIIGYHKMSKVDPPSPGNRDLKPCPTQINLEERFLPRTLRS